MRYRVKCDIMGYPDTDTIRSADSMREAAAQVAVGTHRAYWVGGTTGGGDSLFFGEHVDFPVYDGQRQRAIGRCWVKES